MVRISFIFLIFLLAIVTPSAWSSVYKWTDENGQFHFSDDIRNVPEAYRGRMEKRSSSSETTQREREPAKQPIILFEQKSDINGKNKKWWQGLVRKWEEKKRDAEDRIDELKLEIRQLETDRKTAGSDREKSRLKRLVQGAELRKNVAIRMLNEGLPEEARRAGAPMEWLNKP
jgi:hypothetical protein